MLQVYTPPEAALTPCTNTHAHTHINDFRSKFQFQKKLQTDRVVKQHRVVQQRPRAGQQHRQTQQTQNHLLVRVEITATPPPTEDAKNNVHLNRRVDIITLTTPVFYLFRTTELAKSIEPTRKKKKKKNVPYAFNTCPLIRCRTNKNENNN